MKVLLYRNQGLMKRARLHLNLLNKETDEKARKATCELISLAEQHRATEKEREAASRKKAEAQQADSPTVDGVDAPQVETYESEDESDDEDDYDLAVLLPRGS